MRSDTFDFEVPPQRIAQTPAERRDASRLMVVRRAAGVIEHHWFHELPALLSPDDLLVANDTRVRPCRLYATRATGGRVEVFLLREAGPGHYEAITGAGGRLEPGEVLRLEDARVHLISRDATGQWLLRLEAADPAALMERAGKMPLPQYIRREKGPDSHDRLDRERYQTVFARREGAVAAPTAGLHFTPEVFAALDQRGVHHAFVTLHVGLGTFRPLKAETLAGHDMHAEGYEVSPGVEGAVRQARARGGRVIAVGTTTCRTLETVSDEFGLPRAGGGETSLFIYPPWRFRCVDALLTNFHLPRSTLIFLVAAYLGVELTRHAYLEAIAGDYRFFSYGDAMLCLP